ncbi:hypothetical protein BC827DRAFT_1157680 [Russula dissimulans]|nr:hypothetical protein BC827DRAFT_1157680 [Russula dissimulans]
MMESGPGGRGRTGNGVLNKVDRDRCMTSLFTTANCVTERHPSGSKGTGRHKRFREWGTAGNRPNSVTKSKNAGRDGQRMEAVREKGGKIKAKTIRMGRTRRLGVAPGGKKKRGRIYCSDACQALDDSSPSLSTASSAWPSPSLPPVAAASTQEPSSFALGMSLATTKSAYPPAYPIWYDDDDSHDVDLLSVNPSEDALLRSHHDALSYARRPSSTNTHSTIPLLYRHSSSSTTTTHSSTGHSTNSAEDDSDISGPTSSSHHHRRRSYGTPLRLPAPLTTADVPEATVTSRRRNRASLPSYFSLLTLGAPNAKSSLPLSPPRSSVETARMRPSPTNPRLSHPTIDNTHAVAGTSPSSVPFLTSNPEAYRGRRREPGSPTRARPRSPSRSRSHSRSLEWASGREEMRGRLRVEELDGWAADRQHGYGRGRSGLRDRAERVNGVRR